MPLARKAFDERLILPGDRIEATFIDCADAERATDEAQRPLLKAALSAARADAG